jgi:parallel beta-helix repeat protein
MLTIIILLSESVLVGNMHVNTVQAYSEEKGIINSDTTWTKANSPYNLTGNMAIDKGVTLTIESGVTVNLNKYYIRVNGTLNARGTSTDNIYLNAATDGYIEFTASSTGWNSQTGTGSIIANVVVNTILRTGGSSIMVNNNTITKGISLGGGSPIISKNTIAILSDDPQSEATAIGISNENTALIVDNTISGGFEQATIVVGNGSPTIQRNLISNSYGYGGDAGYGQAGIVISGDASPIIKQNTITQCANGIHVGGSPTPTIVNNNIETITSFNLYMGSRTVNIDASNNWWGTTDTAVIDQKIYDYYDDFNLGKVNYTPLLTAANPQAMPDPNAPTPTPNTSPSPTSNPSTSPTHNPTTTPNQPWTGNMTFLDLDWAEIAIITLLSVIAVLLVLVVVFLRKRSIK